ncbi:uncharacterized protein LOC122503929 [Leptopilina heterotoma]|uniref:uncharacterized protein LOC122503929 n=1 Tax=Leptopilina heterotoma TaxID=63436 RepID=UPI001CA9AE3A|nr:uncharacterized protein LOC122503929 [Leptopilina heterotoma]
MFFDWSVCKKLPNETRLIAEDTTVSLSKAGFTRHDCSCKTIERPSCLQTASAEEKNSQWNSTVDFLKMKNILIHQENIFNALNVLFQSRMQESGIKINQEAQNIYDTLNQKIFTSKKKINDELKEILRSNFLIANTDRSECYKIKIKTSKDSFNKSENCRTCLFNITSNFTIEVNKLKEKFLLFKQNVTLMKKETENCVENNINQTLKSEEIQCIEKN